MHRNPTTCETILIGIINLGLLSLSCVAFGQSQLDSALICTLLIALFTTAYTIIRICIPDYEGGQSGAFIIVTFPLIMWCINELTNNLNINELLHYALTGYVIIYVVLFIETILQCEGDGNVQILPTSVE
jgi:hypothetical protein